MKLKACLIGLTVAICGFSYVSLDASAINKPTKLMNSSSAQGAVEGWYFRAVSGYPVAVTFEPVVLFKNGDYWEAGAETLESLNAAS